MASIESQPPETQGPSEPLHPQTQGFTRARRRWIHWLGVALMAAIAVGSGILSARLRDHADQRRQFMDELTQLEVQATAHSMTIWRALTMLMAEEKMQFIRLRGEAASKGREIATRLERLIDLHQSDATLTELLGFQQDPEPIELLDQSTHRFLGSVQGALGQMNLSADRVRERLRYWDMNFGPFQESLQAVKLRQGEIAEASAAVARRVTAAAGLTRLIASMMLVWTFSRRRAKTRRVRPKSSKNGAEGAASVPKGALESSAPETRAA